MKRILISDDQPHVRRVLQLALERQGYEVTLETNGENALKRIKETPPDVLITDIYMPRMTGKELCQTIQRDHPDRNFFIFVMTSSAEREEREWVKDISNVEFLEKPLSPMLLVARLEEYFNNGNAEDLDE